MDKIETIGLEKLTHLFQIDGSELVYRKKVSNRQKTLIAGWIDHKGYRQVSINRKKCLAHRVVFFMTHGYVPPIVDHINQNKLDNSPKNLRAATPEQNLANSTRPAKNNSSGYRGICYRPKTKKWLAQITYKRKRIFWGEYKILQDAVSAYEVAYKNHIEQIF